MKIIMVVAISLLVLAVPSFALLDTTNNDNSVNSASTSASTSNPVQNFSPDNRNTNTAINGADSDSSAKIGDIETEQKQGQMQGQGQIAAQGQAQKSDQANSQSMGGDKVTSYVMVSPNTVAGDGQTAMAAYSIFGGVNVAESAEYKVCIEKIRLLDQMNAAGLITKEDAIAKADVVYAELEESTQPKRFLWIGPKTRGKHLGNALGLLAMDPCKEINSDNWFGTKDLIKKK